MGAAVDCELIGSGLLGQPVNALTSLALVAVGLLLAARDRWVAAALVATGVGSFLFHGPLAPGGEWIHDVTLAWLVLIVGLRSRGWAQRFGAMGLAAIGLVFLLAPAIAEPLTVALVTVTLWFLLSDGRRLDTFGPVTLLGASALVGRLGATGGPLCDPDSLVQTHGLWHIGAAAAVGWWAIIRDGGDGNDDSLSESDASASDAEFS